MRTQTTKTSETGSTPHVPRSKSGQYYHTSAAD